MDNKQKWVNLTYVAVALLTGYVVFSLATKFSVALDFEGRIRSLDKILLAAGALSGLMVFLILSRNNAVNTFMSEVVAEVSKVSWPTRDETTKGTIAVLIAVVVSGLALWLIDSVGVYLLGFVL